MEFKNFFQFFEKTFRKNIFLLLLRNKLIEFKDTSLIKVITGLRRTGKSSLLKLMVMYLKKHGIKSDRIIEINFESKMNCDDIYEYVNKSDKKIILTLNCGLEKDYDGIKVYNLIEWLLGE